MRLSSKSKLWTAVAVLMTLTLLGVLYLLLTYSDPEQPLRHPPAEGEDGRQPLSVHSTGEPAPTASPPPTPEPTPQFLDAVWIGVGDVMSHTPQLPGAYDAASKTYNFDPYFAGVKPILEKGDWVMANLETPIAGASFGYTGYPTFNAPVELAEALNNAGFNLLSTANNHSLDKGEKGLLATLDNLRELGMQHIGTAASQEEADTLVISEKNGIKMGLLAYTYGTNGIPVPEGKPYLVALIDEEKIKEDIHRLRSSGVDLITVALHFGSEYQTQPNEAQKTLARSLAAAGADIIAGSHPHVVQPYEIVDAFDEEGRKRQSLIIYSMGNFISNQRGDWKDYGVIFKVHIRKQLPEGIIQLREVEAIPTWVHRYKPDHAYRYRILPVEETIAEATDELLVPEQYATLQKDLAVLKERLDSMK
ncbi:CapA family protein [Paenibacillus chungangensis]|uniref:CapA family protein n=1 Tax=Paenibacillus chungangensis TaxID=696535 RepID=A0ABW3HN25_9BACL